MTIQSILRGTLCAGKSILHIDIERLERRAEQLAVVRRELVGKQPGGINKGREVVHVAESPFALQFARIL